MASTHLRVKTKLYANFILGILKIDNLESPKSKRVMTLPSYLFWDVDVSSLDLEKNARFIIHRVIQKGSLRDWCLIKNKYGTPRIREEILMVRDLDDKTLHFFSVYFGIN